MHAVIVSVTVIDGEKATEHLRNEVVPQVKEAPGFVAGYWTRIAADKGRASIVFESEEAAKAAAERVREQGGDFVSFDSVDVGEVVASA